MKTKEKRLKVYKASFNYLHHFNGLCSAIARAHLQEFKRYIQLVDVTNKYPELLKYKPEDAPRNDYWWELGNLTVRKNVLNAIIKELEDELQEHK